MRVLPTSLLLAALLGLSQCKKTDLASKLPPATQTGANTFGCLVNGQPWTPQGNSGFSNYDLFYDSSYRYGTLAINTYRIFDKSTRQQYISISSDSLPQPGVYLIKSTGRQGCHFLDLQSPCKYYSSDKDTYCRGKLTITRLNRAAGVISGTFAFTLYKPNCDSVYITEGRFDHQI